VCTHTEFVQMLQFVTQNGIVPIVDSVHAFTHAGVKCAFQKIRVSSQFGKIVLRIHTHTHTQTHTHTHTHALSASYASSSALVDNDNNKLSAHIPTHTRARNATKIMSKL